MGYSDPVLGWPRGAQRKSGVGEGHGQAPHALIRAFFFGNRAKESQEQTQEHLDGDKRAETLRWVESRWE